MRSAFAAAFLLALAAPALAAAGDPIPLGPGITFDPIVDGRLRYERVELPTADADALTMRIRAGGEVRAGHWSLLAESEATLGIDKGYNAFAFASPSHQRRPQQAVVADPENIELNRLQLQYRAEGATLTVGRQRINLDDQRFVGSVGWRQNEQSFDAVRLDARAGPFHVDGSYAVRQRSIFGIDSGPRQSYGGHFWFLGAGAGLGPVALKGFAYLLDYDPAFFLANSSQTYGVRATTAIPLTDAPADPVADAASGAKLALAASYARQSAHGGNPLSYAADYLAAEASLGWKGLTLTGGYERLGSDSKAANGLGRAVQTPMATAHKFNGWADLFATTPDRGLRDLYAGAGYRFERAPIPGLNAAVAWHRFDSAVHGIDYGREWDASLGFRLSRMAILAKFADYKARGFGADTRKFWLQAEFGY